jgi:hypothetical protein
MLLHAWRRTAPGRRPARSPAALGRPTRENTSALGEPLPRAGVREAAAPAAHLGGPAAVEVQLGRVESRLLAEAAGDSALAADVRRFLDDARLRFSAAPVRQFVPILIEREVRRRLREEVPSG